MKGRSNIAILLFLTITLSQVSAAVPLSELAKTDLLQQQINEFEAEYLEHISMEEYRLQRENKQKLKKLIGETKYHCTGGVNPSNLSNKEYLTAFAAGPCNPAVFVPGITASKLHVQIDCKTFKKARPNVFKACGWHQCWTPGVLSPKKEYKVWMPSLLGPMAFTIPTKAVRECFTGIFGQHVTGSGSNIKVTDPPGIQIHAIGATPKTRAKKTGECGFKSIQNLLPLTFQTGGYAGWINMKEAFLGAGYRVGLTFQAMPYDYRIDQRNSELNKRFPKVMDSLTAITGKKVVMVGHSYGNFQIANYLWQLNQQERDQKVARFISLAPPFSGAVDPLHLVLGMDTAFGVDVGTMEFGPGVFFFKNGLWTFKGSYALAPRDIFSIDQNEPYMKAIFDRIKAEKEGTTPPTGTVMDIFPNPSETCVVGFKDRDSRCVLGMTDFRNFGSVNGDELNYSSIPEILRKYSFAPLAGDLYESEVDPRFNYMENLGVQVNLVFSGAIKTPSKIIYNSDPKIKTDKDEIYLPDKKELEMGDKTVLTTSALTAAIKWADHFRTGVKDAKPVNFIEICSIKNQRESVFEPGTTKVTKNAYFGIPCNCKGTAAKPVDGLKCGADHGPMLLDPNLISFVLKSAFDGEKGQVSSEWEAKTDKEIQSYQDNCDMFNQL